MLHVCVEKKLLFFSPVEDDHAHLNWVSMFSLIKGCFKRIMSFELLQGFSCAAYVQGVLSFINGSLSGAIQKLQNGGDRR